MIDLQPYIERIADEKDIFSKARLLHHLVYDKEVRIVHVASALNKQSSYICHLLRLVRLPEMIIDGYYSELISVSHLFIISRIKDKEKLLSVYEELLKSPHTIAQTEELVRETIYGMKTSEARLSKSEIAASEAKIQQTDTSIRTKVIQTRIKGKIIVEIKGDTQQTTPILKKLLTKLAE